MCPVGCLKIKQVPSRVDQYAKQCDKVPFQWRKQGAKAHIAYIIASFSELK